MALISSHLPSGDWKASDGFEPITYEKLIGISNLLNIAWLSQGLTLAAAVARVVTPDGPGTGFLIAPDLLLTNNHVLPTAAVAAASTAEFNYQLSWSGTLEPVKRFPLDPTMFRTSEDLDYSIVRVKDSPGDLYGYVDFSNRADPTINDFVSIIQHPNGGPKQISITDNKVAAIFDDLVQYATDTEPGSSGSPVFNQSWQIVGLHHRGGELAGPDGKRYFTNEGICISAVLRDAVTFLGLTDPLYDLAFGDVRPVLVKLIERADPPTTADAVLPTLIRTRPSFSFAFDQWTQLYGQPGQGADAALACAGVAVGAALRQWARSEGHEAISAASAATPAPTAELRQLVSHYYGTNTVPSQVYREVLTARRAREESRRMRHDDSSPRLPVAGGHSRARRRGVESSRRIVQGPAGKHPGVVSSEGTHHPGVLCAACRASVAGQAATSERSTYCRIPPLR